MLLCVCYVQQRHKTVTGYLSGDNPNVTHYLSGRNAPECLMRSSDNEETVTGYMTGHDVCSVPWRHTRHSDWLFEWTQCRCVSVLCSSDTQNTLTIILS